VEEPRERADAAAQHGMAAPQRHRSHSSTAVTRSMQPTRKGAAPRPQHPLGDGTDSAVRSRNGSPARAGIGDGQDGLLRKRCCNSSPSMEEQEKGEAQEGIAMGSTPTDPELVHNYLLPGVR
jgi:hypothetical protein